MSDIEYTDPQNHPRELIKCVLIGDTGVGKTRLICAEALGVGMKGPLPMKHFHYPSVFAIDQYHVSDEIRERANFIVDGVNVALRLWDTFGDHHMNRKYAYQNAHVVVLCFNISLPCSFKNVNAIWYPEIKKFCPRTPIILVGTQSDWRWNSTENIKNIITTTVSLSKRMRECALVSPDMGRQVAKEIGATYYESSVITMYGVKAVFENACRAALIARRQTRFWSSHLKRVKKPLLQQPYLPEKTSMPLVIVPESQYFKNMHNLLNSQESMDVQFIVGQYVLEAHSAILCLVSTLFSHLLLSHGIFGRFADESFLVKCLSDGDDRMLLVFQDALVLGKPGLLPRGFFSINVLKEEDSLNRGKIVVEVDSSIPPNAFQNVLNFYYSGFLHGSVCTEELLSIAEYLQLNTLMYYIDHSINSSSYNGTDVCPSLNHRVVTGGKALVNQKCMSDISFIVDGKTVHAHKILIVSQCEMLAAMFMHGHFKESIYQLVELKEVSNYTSFVIVLQYLYTGHCSPISLDKALDVICLANFLCLPRLVTLCEQLITKDFQVAMEKDELSVTGDVIACLVEAQIHNASQLEAWCLSYIANHYDQVCRRHPKEFKMLKPDTHDFLHQQRWPPIWYLIENDWYEKEIRDQDKGKRGLKSAVKKKRCHCL